MTEVGPLADVEIIGTVPPIPSAEVLVLMAGIVMLVKWAGTLTKAPATIDLSDALPKAWSPTIELAKEATAQLRSRGSSRMITMTEKYRELHIQNRAATWHMENWYRPIRIWYNDDAAGADY